MYILFKQRDIFSAVEPEQSKYIVTGSDQTIQCYVSELSSTPVTVVWIDPQNNLISASDTSNYIINQGSVLNGNQTTTLTIKTPILSLMTSQQLYKCRVKSQQYPTSSPDIEKNITLDPLTLGWFLMITFEQKFLPK